METINQPRNTVKARISKLLLNYTTICIVISGCCVCLYLFLNEGPGKYVIDKYHTTDLTLDEYNELDSSSKAAIGSRYLEIYTARKEHYTKSSGALSTIINGLGVCCLISLLALYYEKKESMSIAGIAIPFKSVFLILPVLMLYLWLSFGFTYFSALDSRQICYVAAAKYESSADSLHTGNLCSSKDFRLMHNLEDMGIIDGSVNYFNGFYTNQVYNFFYKNHDLLYNDGGEPDTEKLPERLKLPIREWPDVIVVISFFAIFGTLFGLSIGFIITLLIRFQNLPNTNTRYASWLVKIIFMLICLSFVGFCYMKPYLLPFVAYIWLVAALVLYIYIVRLKKEPQIA